MLQIIANYCRIRHFNFFVKKHQPWSPRVLHSLQQCAVFKDYCSVSTGNLHQYCTVWSIWPFFTPEWSYYTGLWEMEGDKAPSKNGGTSAGSVLCKQKCLRRQHLCTVQSCWKLKINCISLFNATVSFGNQARIVYDNISFMQYFLGWFWFCWDVSSWT